jgi:hypothetical protein
MKSGLKRLHNDRAFSYARGRIGLNVFAFLRLIAESE